MTLIDKIKKSVEGATGLPFLYHAAGEINELIARCQSLPVAYSFLIDSGTIDDVNGRYHERVTLAVMFCDKTEFDFNALENEEIIDRMKEKAYKWMSSLRMSNTLNVVSVNNTQRLYDNTTDILTGFAVNITLEDITGVGECELPQVVIDVKKNGSYDVVGVDKVRVKVLPKMDELEVTKNGEYLPPTDITGFSKVSVNVQPVLEELSITQNGEYLPQDGVDGFRKVVAEFDTSSLPRVKVTGFGVSNNCINDEGRWEGEQLIDTSEVTSLSSRFEGLSKLKTLNASNWNVSKVTTINSFVCACRNLEEINLTGWNTSSLKTMSYPFMQSGIKEFNFGDLNTSKVTSMFEVFYQCSKLVKCNVTNWDVRQVTDMRYMFALTKIRSLDLINWEVNASVKMNEIFWKLPSLISVVGDRTIEEVLEGDISAIKNCHFALVLNETNLDRASLRAIINGLADLSDTTAKTLTLGATLRKKLTEEDIAVATNKNWTIV